ncbi:hypothetical protein [Sphingomonas parapaucimobilis]|jgi:hypothetical protein|uniref:Uncharacterized protein n=1 Tax=Sphingomonas parapaucimobilis NBRC 15100 TaxID=1219049 RepID=A0A0A1W707_9SPHN|nr:hypothetical protein [Sphingomonas parapaucimobilis]GAM00694.1 hypothetical protein SP5_035_00930 [Sphingomonas parapaucimobilis NBRC 15100]
MMMFALLAAAVLSAPSPREEAAKPAAPAVETAALPTAPTAAAKPTRYCFLNVQEDHIMRGKVCLTRKQWMWRGVDPLDYLGRNK